MQNRIKLTDKTIRTALTVFEETKKDTVVYPKLLAQITEYFVNNRSDYQALSAIKYLNRVSSNAILTTNNVLLHHRCLINSLLKTDDEALFNILIDNTLGHELSPVFIRQLLTLLTHRNSLVALKYFQQIFTVFSNHDLNASIPLTSAAAEASTLHDIVFQHLCSVYDKCKTDKNNIIHIPAALGFIKTTLRLCSPSFIKKTLLYIEQEAKKDPGSKWTEFVSLYQNMQSKSADATDTAEALTIKGYQKSFNEFSNFKFTFFSTMPSGLIDYLAETCAKDPDFHLSTECTANKTN